MAGRIAIALVQYPSAKLTDLEAVRARIQKELEDRPQTASETMQDVVVRAMAAGLAMDKKAARNVIKAGDEERQDSGPTREKARRRADAG